MQRYMKKNIAKTNKSDGANFFSVNCRVIDR